MISKEEFKLLMLVKNKKTLHDKCDSHILYSLRIEKKYIYFDNDRYKLSLYGLEAINEYKRSKRKFALDLFTVLIAAVSLIISVCVAIFK